MSRSGHRRRTRRLDATSETADDRAGSRCATAADTNARLSIATPVSASRTVVRQRSSGRLSRAFWTTGQLDQDGIVAPAQTGPLALVVPLRRGTGQRHRLARRVRGADDQAHVLDEDVQRAADGLERTGQHPFTTVVEHEGRGRAVPDGLPARPRVQAERLGEGQRFGRRGDVHPAQQLVDQLHPLTVPRHRPDDRSLPGQRRHQLSHPL